METKTTQRMREIRKTPDWWFLPIARVEIHEPQEEPTKGLVHVHFTKDVMFSADILAAGRGNVSHIVEPTDMMAGLFNSRTEEMQAHGFSLDKRKNLRVERLSKSPSHYRPLSPFAVRTDDMNNLFLAEHAGRKYAIPLQDFAIVSQPFHEDAIRDEDFSTLSTLGRNRPNEIKFRWGIDLGELTFCRTTVEEAQKRHRAMVPGSAEVEAEWERKLGKLEMLTPDERRGVENFFHQVARDKSYLVSG